MQGTTGADLFRFNSLEGFGKQYADRIINFNGNEGDRLQIERSILPDGVERIRFKAARTGRQLRQAFNSKKTVLYDRRDGELFINANGREPGSGDGGLLAILDGSPRLRKTHLELIDSSGL